MLNKAMAVFQPWDNKTIVGRCERIDRCNVVPGRCGPDWEIRDHTSQGGSIRGGKICFGKGVKSEGNKGLHREGLAYGHGGKHILTYLARRIINR
jgi:hypothetical protein